MNKYDFIKCGVCGVGWTHHGNDESRDPQACSRKREDQFQGASIVHARSEDLKVVEVNSRDVQAESEKLSSDKPVKD